MADESLAARLDEIMPCLDAKLGGRDKAIVARRRALAEFFHYCAIYCEPAQWPGIGVAVTHLAGYSEGCADAIERLLDEPASLDEASQHIYEALDKVWNILFDAMPAIEAALAAGRATDAAAACCQALGTVFDWEENGHHRAHVYIRTGEKLKDGLLGKERTTFLKAVRDCLKEINP